MYIKFTRRPINEMSNKAFPSSTPMIFDIAREPVAGGGAVVGERCRAGGRGAEEERVCRAEAWGEEELSVAWFSFTLIARKAGEGYEICFRRRASRRAGREGLSRVNLECERADSTP